MKERLYCFAWQLLLGGASAKLWALYRHFGSFETAWSARRNDFYPVPELRGLVQEGLLDKRAGIDPGYEWGQLERKGIDFICYHDANYPESLRTIYDPPPGLFIRGQLRDGLPAVALVGSRKATHYGKKIAGELGRDLARAGVTVVSGMARGIDTAAHRGALQSGGYTVAVLGCGADVVYPRENGRVMEEIASAGAIISEFPPGSAPEAWHFPVRNRIISGFSRCVVVVEAAERSGALITADAALEQGRDVAAVPGNVSSRMSKGANGLIKQGAKLVESAADILEELGMHTLFPVEKEREESLEARLTPAESKIYSVLSSEPVHLDELIHRAGVSPGEALSLLMYLEVKGLVKQLPGKMFVQG